MVGGEVGDREVPVVRDTGWGRIHRVLVKGVSVLLLLLAAAGAVKAVWGPVGQLTVPWADVPVLISGHGTNAEHEAFLNLIALPDQTYLTDQHLTVFTYEVYHAPWHLRLLTELPVSLLAVGLAVGSLLLHRLLESFLAGAPFHPRNPRRLTWLGAVVAVAGFGGPFIEDAATNALLAHAGATEALASAARWNLGYLFAAVVLLAVAGAFRVGRRLTEDADGLV